MRYIQVDVTDILHICMSLIDTPERYDGLIALKDRSLFKDCGGEFTN